MTRKWKAGDVGVMGSKRIVYIRRRDGLWDGIDRFGESYTRRDIDSHIRPLVVIDPEDREAVARLGELIRDQHQNNVFATDDVQAALREFANPTPPRIDQPGTWGVVEASCVHSDQRHEWARHEDGNWYPIGSVGREAGLPDDWDSLKEPVLIREGVDR